MRICRFKRVLLLAISSDHKWICMATLHCCVVRVFFKWLVVPYSGGYSIVLYSACWALLGSVKALRQTSMREPDCASMASHLQHRSNHITYRKNLNTFDVVRVYLVIWLDTIF